MLQYQRSDVLCNLIDSLYKAVAADKIFLLGEKYNDNTVNTIFNPGKVANTPAASYFMLLLTRAGESRSDDVIIDMLEQRNLYRTPINLIVTSAKAFYKWIKELQPFALRVISNSPLLYDAGITSVPRPDESIREDIPDNQASQAVNACERSCSFLAGAELYLLRKEYHMCAFHCHQAIEHACLSFIMWHIGLRTGTHNIDKLFRYSTMVCNSLAETFPRIEEEDKELFRLLQKAYIEARYKNYVISEFQIHQLIDRVRKIINLVTLQITMVMRA